MRKRMEISLRKKLEQSLKLYRANNCVEFDTGEDVESLTFSDVESVVQKIGNFLDTSSKFLAVAFDLDSKNVVGYPPAIFTAVLFRKAFFVIDLKNQTWEWISETLKMFGIDCIACDRKFKVLLMQNTALKLKSSSVVRHKFLEIEILHLAVQQVVLEAPFSDLTYLVQTSGTSGNRKTILVSERSIIANVQDFIDTFNLSEERVFAAAPPTFDPFYVDLFLSALTGSCLLFVPTSLKTSSKLLPSILFTRNTLTYLQITPSLYRLLSSAIEEIVSSNRNFLNHIVLGGEPFPKIPSKLLSSSKTKFYNVYGVTEMSCWQSMVQVSDSNPFIFSFQNSSTQLLKHCTFDVLSKKGQLYSSIQTNKVFEGELIVSSKTRICFVSDDSQKRNFSSLTSCTPYVVNTRDVVTVDTEGNVRIRGRSDDVIKVNGKRTSLSEISAALQNILSVEVVCMKIEDFVVGFVADQNSCDVQEMLHLCRQKIPGHLIPHDLFSTNGFPLTLNGKLDHKLLINAYLHQKNLRKRNHDGNLISIISSVWLDNLRSVPDPKSRFSDLGGDSMMAVKMVQEFEELSKAVLPELVDKILNTSFEEIVHYLEKFRPDESREKRTKREAESLTSHPGSTKFEVEKIMMNFASKGKSERFPTFPLSITSSKIAWQADLLKCIDASPLLVQNATGSWTIYIGSHSGIFISIDLSSGVEHWRVTLPGRIEATAAISNCRHFVFVGCYDCKMYCLSSKDGSKVWTYATEGMIKSTASFIRDVLIFGSYDKKLHCVTLSSGEPRFRSATFDGSITTESIPVDVESSAVLVSTLSGELAILELDTGGILTRKQFSAPFFSTPVVKENTVVVATVRGTVCALKTTEGLTEVWRLETNAAIFSSLALKDDKVFFGSHDNRVYCIDSTAGHIVWVCHHSSPVFATPHVAGNVVVSVSTKGVVKATNFLSGLDIFECTISSSEFFSSPVLVQDNLVIGSRNNQLYCIKLY